MRPRSSSTRSSTRNVTFPLTGHPRVLPLGMRPVIRRHLPAEEPPQARLLQPPSPEPQLTPGRLQAALGINRGAVVHLSERDNLRSRGGPGGDIAKRWSEEWGRAAYPNTRQRCSRIHRRLEGRLVGRLRGRFMTRPPQDAEMSRMHRRKGGRLLDATRVDSRGVSQPSRTHGHHRRGPVGVQQRDLEQSSAVRRFPCTVLRVSDSIHL